MRAAKLKISEKQLQLLFQTLIDSITVDITQLFSLDIQTRKKLYEQIINQQSDQLIDIKGKE